MRAERIYHHLIRGYHPVTIMERFGLTDRELLSYVVQLAYERGLIESAYVSIERRAANARYWRALFAGRSLGV